MPVILDGRPKASRDRPLRSISCLSAEFAESMAPQLLDLPSPPFETSALRQRGAGRASRRSSPQGRLRRRLRRCALRTLDRPLSARLGLGKRFKPDQARSAPAA